MLGESVRETGEWERSDRPEENFWEVLRGTPLAKEMS